MEEIELLRQQRDSLCAMTHSWCAMTHLLCDMSHSFTCALIQSALMEEIELLRQQRQRQTAQVALLKAKVT